MFILIYMFGFSNGVVFSQPIISPSGTVDIVQGKNLTLTCTYQSDPTQVQHIGWSIWNSSTYRFILSIYDNPGTTCTYFDGDRTEYGYTCPANNQFNLIIYNVQRSNRQGSTWRCEHRVGAGDRLLSTNVTLNVQVSVSSVTLTPALDSLSVIAGRSREFRCQTSQGAPAPRVQWFKFSDTGGPDINITSLSVSSLSEAGTSSVLTFVPTKDDQGLRIKCSAQNVGSMIESAKKPSLDILYGPSKPVCTYNGQNSAGTLHIIQGRTLNISCSSISKPAPHQYKWTYPGGSYTGQQLTIANINLSFNGTFTFEAMNTMNPTEGLSVTDSNFSTVEVDVLYPPSMPTFSIDNKTLSGTIKIISGNSKTIRCASKSNPVPSYTWSSGGTSNNADLILNNVQHPTNNGQYTCTVKNTMLSTEGTLESGQAAASITVEVLYISKPVFYYGSVTGSLITSNALTVVKGGGRSVYCVSQSNPSVSNYAWTGYSSTQLLLTSSINDNANVSCVVSNIMEETSSFNTTFGNRLTGSEQQTLSVIVLKPPDVPGIFYQPQCSTTGMISAPSVLKVIEGASLCLSCFSTSIPASTYRWSGPASSTTNVLTVVNISREVAKLTACMAENTMITTFDGTVTGSNTNNITIDVLYGPSVKEIKDQKIEKGSRFQYNCVFTDGNPADTTVLWTRSGSNDKWPTQQLDLPSVQRKDDANYTCTAANALNPTGGPNQNMTDYKSFHLDVLFGAENLVFNLDQYQVSSSFNVTENRTVTLKCALESNPGSTIVISKDREKKYTVSDTRSATYSIDGKCDDAGVYTCTGSNQYPGNQSKDIDIHILCTPRAAPHVHISYNVSSAREVNATMSFTALAFPPLHQSSCSWKKCTTSGCEPVSLDKAVVNFSIRGFGNRLAECNLTIFNVQEEDYTEYQIAVNGSADRKWSFFLKALDKPGPPTDLMVIDKSVTETSANVTWKSGFNGGLPQTFQLKIRKKGNSEWTVHTIQETSAIYTGNMYFVVNGLQSGSEYELQLFAFNEKGNSSLVFGEFSTLQHIDVQRTSNGALIGGAVGGSSVAIIGIIVIVVIIIRNKQGGHKKKRSEFTGELMKTNSDHCEEIPDEVRNPMYISAGEVDTTTANAPVYASPIKKSSKPSTDKGDLYATVDVNKKSKKPTSSAKKDAKKDKGKKTADKHHDVYENPQLGTSKKSYDNKAFEENVYENNTPVKSQKRVNADGLIYADLDFPNQPKGQKRLVIHGLDDKTEYAEVDLTRKADPLPDSDTEEKKTTDNKK